MLAAGLSLASVFSGPGTVAAQSAGTRATSILTISSDRLFNESAFGRRIAGEIEAESAVLAAENRRIEAELVAEEQALTDRRPGMEPDAFRVLADAFDQKVGQIRLEQESKGRALAQRSEKARIEFLNAAAPVLNGLMQDANAGVILERSSVFFSADVTDITDLAINRIDQAIGDGSRPEPETGE
jgi:Skp family chaperone for outer membrane proteins